MNKKIILFISMCILSTMVLFGCRASIKTDIPNVNAVNYINLDKEIPKIIEEKIEDRIEEISILAVGDIMFHSPQVRAAYLGEGKYDFIPTFKYVKKYIDRADLALANYETVTLKNKPYSGFPRFNSPKETIFALADAGFDILSTANNHCLDQGKEGILSTLDAVEEYGLKSIGTNKDKEENILIEDVKGIKIGLLSYTYGLNGLDSLLSKDDMSYMINIIDEKRIEEDIKKTKDLGADLTILFLHWGNEYHNNPSNYQIELGEKIIGWGGDIVLGSHPHVIQKSKINNDDNNFIIYSMGNFLSNQRKDTMGNQLTEDGVMLEINVEKNFTSGECTIKAVEYIPTWVYKYKANNKIYYEILPIEELLSKSLDIEVKDDILYRVEESLKNTKSTINGK